MESLINTTTANVRSWTNDVASTNPTNTSDSVQTGTIIRGVIFYVGEVSVSVWFSARNVDMEIKLDVRDCKKFLPAWLLPRKYRAEKKSLQNIFK